MGAAVDNDGLPESLLPLAGPVPARMNRWSSTGGVHASTMVAPAGAPTPFPVPPRSPSTCGNRAD
eukprot:6449506-Prymnesium_polylepis.1